MTFEEVDQLLKANPDVGFRIRMSNGKRMKVERQAMLLTHSFLVVGRPVAKGRRICRYVDYITLGDIASLEMPKSHAHA